MTSRWYPPPSKPREVAGGLRARSSRGAIGRSWWSGRFTSVLEDIGLGSRLQRGRAYARRGQVISLDVGAGMVTASVQGSRVRPYRVKIGLTSFGKAQWAKVEHALAENAWYLAKLLSGDMPEDIEDVFAAQGLSLFPAAAGEMSMDCSCPDWEVPCKHIAAAFYLLAEAFDTDPFTILAWRGRERDDLLANLQAARGDPRPAADQAGPGGAPLAERIGTFFALQDSMPEPGPPPGDPAAILGQLPEIDAAVRGKALPDLLAPAYASFASAEALMAALAEPTGPETAGE